MDIFDVLHKELWIYIILKIPYIYMHNVCNISKQFKDLCNQENLFQKIKGFPRKSGHFKYHDITRYEAFLRMINHKNDKYRTLTKCNFNDIFRKNKSHNKNIAKSISYQLLDTLYENNIDLVSGDIINFGDVSEDFLFDGEEIIDIKIHDMRHNLIIPNDLCPIKNNVPIKYWNKSGLEDILFTIQITDIRDELIRNISTNNYQIAYTWFTLNNCIYVIYHNNLNLLTADRLYKKDNIIVYLNINHTNKHVHTFDIKDKVITNQYHIASRLF